MTWPTDLARQSTNPFSAENMISRNLMDQALKAERDRIDENIHEKLSREMDRDGSSGRIADKPSLAYMELSKQLNQKYHKSKPKSATTSDSSASSSLETSTSSNSSNSSFKERIISNNTTTKTNTNKSCSIQ
ncbi:hypothetical protein [Candidatus Rhabdochlamydia sp. T3358]|uniref:hypothetical protein n=1 Tax=Candidatus Rhabdochlamydia sp. T3358 TaxID=2099795 RepID=UPI0010B84CE0|nr:hypothetical protein [Candidatus Rhabdochlamydia sp. T3358]VHO02417.1 hypothetical protein RHT_00501 [Candidatus Rhabdochlamydia sp. T3358]